MNDSDAQNAERLGLITFRPFEFCENCEEPVAYTPNGFYPCVVVLTVDKDDEEVEFILCDSCVRPILNPGIIS